MRLLFDGNMIAELHEISWNRFHLRFRISLSGVMGEPSFFLVETGLSSGAQCKLDLIQQDGTNCLVESNITNNGRRECVQPGSYYLVCVDERGRWCEVTLVKEGVSSAIASARAFPYGQRGWAQVVYFDVAEINQRNAVIVEVIATELDDKGFRELAGWNQEQIALLKRRLSANDWLERIEKKLLKCLYRQYRTSIVASRMKPRIVFLSERSDSLRPNMHSVYAELSKSELAVSHVIEKRCYVSTRHTERLYHWARSVLSCAVADCIIVDDYVPLLTWLKLADDTKIIQLWHAMAGMKAVGYDRWGLPGAPVPINAHRRYTYAVCASSQMREVFSERFGIEKEAIIPLGVPRTDRLFNHASLGAKREILSTRFPACVGKKVVLFAPTYRGRGIQDAEYPYEVIDFEMLYRACGDDQVVLFKMHPWVQAPVPIPSCYGDRLVDASFVEDISELLILADVLITDYSSVAFEFSLLGKPIVFFTFDVQDYSLKRGFRNGDCISPPKGIVCSSFLELAHVIEAKEYEADACMKSDTASMQLGMVDGQASKRVVEWLIKGDLPSRYRDAQTRYLQRLNDYSSYVFARSQ